jgi:O-acetyl-ADP-ribose deacetylase (regulator of RNase III)
MNTRIQIHQGDITKLNVDIIVNAANSSLSGGGGVDGAIHRAAGPELLEECLSLKGCPTGEVRITKGYQLKASHVIHAVGPIWRGGQHNEAELLKQCYQNSLRLAKKNHAKTIAFPNISTGVYGFPKADAAHIAYNSVVEFLKENDLPEKVIFVVFDEDNLHLYERLVNETR